MHGKNRFFCSLFTCLLLFSLVSCGNGTETASSGPQPTSVPAVLSDVPDTRAPVGTDTDVTSAPLSTASPETTAAPGTAKEPVTTLPVTTDSPKPQDPDVPLGIYVWMNPQDKKTFTRVADFASRWPENDADYIGQWATGHWTKDTWNFPGETHLICDTKYFFVIPSDAPTITFRNPCWTAAWSREWSDLWNAAGLQGMRIGYQIETVLTSGERLFQRVMSPDGTIFEMAPYYEVYLYDEVNRPDGDHVTASLVTDKTVYTDIKITLRGSCYDIREFLLTAFVYKPDVPNYFDKDGNFRGTLSAEAKIHANNYPPQPPQ